MHPQQRLTKNYSKKGNAPYKCWKIMIAMGHLVIPPFPVVCNNLVFIASQISSRYHYLSGAGGYLEVGWQCSLLRFANYTFVRTQYFR